MKNKIKLAILLIPLIILSTGCTATYKLNITDDKLLESLTIEETFEQSSKNAYYYSTGTLDNYRYNATYVNKYLSEMHTKYKGYYINQDNFNRDNYEIKNRLYDNGYTYYLENEKNYSQKSNSLINNLIKDSLIINDTNIIIHLDNIPNKLVENLDKLSIIITTSLPVTSNNADSVENNTYTWNYDKTNNLNKGISLYIERPKQEETNNNNNKQNNYNKRKDSTAFTLIILIGLYLAIIIVVINVFNKKKKLF